MLAYCPTVVAYEHSHPCTEDPYECAIRDHATFLNELSNRRRVNTFFPNEQSAFYGVQFRYVNSSRGNLTFVRRDLVTVGRIPIVVGRVYDSMSRTDEGFGLGWRLSLAEAIYEPSEDTLNYIDDSGTQTALVRRGGSYVVRVPGPSDIASVEAMDSGLQLVTRSGWTKYFQRNGGRFLLTAVRDAYGNALVLRYDGRRLARIETQNGRFVAIERDANGRIGRVFDDQGRAVTYSYDESGLLRTATDFGGNEWRYDYDALGRLRLAVDPQNIPILEVQSDARHRANIVRVLGGEHRYRYEDARTTIQDEAGRAAFVLHNSFGIATSITSATGFASEVRLDTQNRVTTLLQGFKPKATLSYGANGLIETLTRFDEGGSVILSYVYDARNRPIEIIGSDGSKITLVYNASGDLVRKQQGDQWQEYEYTDRGDLRVVANSYGSTSYAHSSDGQIETITSSRGNTSLAYFPNGRLKSIAFADGSTHQYHYNALGLRESIERSNDRNISYWYDPAGNLIRSIGLDASGRDVGQVFEVDSYYRVKVVHHDDGQVTKVTYDSAGNPETISRFEDPSEPVLSYTYDARNRLVAVADGEQIIGSYVYDGAESDLRNQLDHHTMRVAAADHRNSATVGNIESVVYTRPYGSTFGSVSFDEATQSFELPSDIGIVLPNLVRDNSVHRQELSAIDASIEARIGFDRPSNIAFMPPEYATINCAQNCVFYGIEVRANGSYNPITVTPGSTVSLAAGSPQGTANQCQLLICWWSDNGVYIGGGKTLLHTFETPGAHDVVASCECSPCDLTAIDSIVVNVPTLTLTVSSSAVWPSGTSGPNQVVATAKTSPAISGATITFSASATSGSGGHASHAGTRPVGTFSANTVTTGANGQAQSTWTSPVFGGESKIKATWGEQSATKTVDVRVPSLQQLSGGSTYSIVGSTTTHPVNNWVTSSAASGLTGIASDYKQAYYPTGSMPSGDRLRYNDMSLEKGGKFDLAANWCASCSHAEHRVGVNCDVGSSNVPSSRWPTLMQIFVTRGSPNFLDETATANHWHLRF